MTDERAVASTIIRLMQGVVYRESDADAWATLERSGPAYATISPRSESTSSSTTPRATPISAHGRNKQNRNHFRGWSDAAH